MKFFTNLFEREGSADRPEAEQEKKAATELNSKMENGVRELETGISDAVLNDIRGAISNEANPAVKDMLQKALDRMIIRQQEIERMKKKEQEEEKTQSSFVNSSDQLQSQISAKEIAIILFNAITKNIDQLSAMAIGFFDSEGKQTSQSSSSSIVQISQDRSEDAISGINSMLDKFAQYGFEVKREMYESVNKSGKAVSTLAYSIQFPQGFEVQDISKMTEQDLELAVAMNREQRKQNLPDKPNVYKQVVGSHEVDQLKDFFEKFSKQFSQELVSEMVSSVKDVIRDESLSSTRHEGAFDAGAALRGIKKAGSQTQQI